MASKTMVKVDENGNIRIRKDGVWVDKHGKKLPKQKVYCCECKYYYYQCSEFGEYERCKGKVIYTDTPTCREEDWANPNELNKKNNCKLFVQKPPKVSLWTKIFG